MSIDEQKKYGGSEKLEQPENINKQIEVEKLRAEIADMRKQLAEKKSEMKPEFFGEVPQEGAKNAEQTIGKEKNGFLTPGLIQATLRFTF